MVHRLPPLTALRAFEAAARHMSFAKAAEELHVTPAALSFQIKSLEEHLQAPVFRRLNRAVELTEAGHALAQGTNDAFNSLNAAWRAARRAVDQSSLTVTAGPAFTAKWLAPRMFSFAKAHPEIELRFAAFLRVMDFTHDDVDIAIRFGFPKDEPDYYSQPIIREWLTPMMTSELATKLRRPEDLLNATLLVQEDTKVFDPPFGWREWFKAAGIDADCEAGARFNQADHAHDAAIAGAGVVLGRLSLAERDLREGRLVAPFKIGLRTDAHYRFLCPKGSEDRPQVRAFLNWLEQETEGLDGEFSEGMTFVDAAELA